MGRNITLGQYMPGRSVIHRLDARSKILLLIAYMVFIFMAQNFYALFLMTLASLLVVLATRISLNMYLKSLRVILVVVLITALFNLFYGNGKVLFEWWIFKITEGGLNNAVFVAVRIAALVLISSVLTYTTSPSDLTDALERLLKPLTLFKVKVHELAMMMTLALRFITKGERSRHGKRKRFQAGEGTDSGADTAVCIVIQTCQRPCYGNGMPLL